MKIQCQSCQAKYTIADEKVAGKVVKIRCKRCSETILINGHEVRSLNDAGNMHGFDDPSRSDEQWTVNVADGDQRAMTVREIVTEYHAGTINDETYCWKDDMPDWLPLREIESLYGALGMPSHVSLNDEAQSSNSIPPSEMPLFAANEHTEVLGVASYSNGQSADVANLAPTEAAAPTSGETRPFEVTPAVAFMSDAELAAGAATAVTAPAAARRGGGRGQGADLFGNAAHAGSEVDVSTAIPLGGGDARMAAAHADRLTGQRNENSVLFSLSSLTETAKKREAVASHRTAATAEGSGLIDIRALSANMGVDDSKRATKSRVDDIMNLSGGGAFGAPLAAPILAPPPLEAVDPAAAGKSGRGFGIAILGAAVIVAAAILGGVYVYTRNAPSPGSGTPITSVSPTANVAANEPPVTPPAATAAPTAENPAPSPPGTGQAIVPVGQQVARPPTGNRTNTGVAVGPKPVPVETPRPTGATDLGSAMASAAGQSPAAPKPTGGGGSTAPFDRGAAAASLGGINVQSCKKSDGPTGTGHVKVTFNPDGNVATAVVDGGPFPGTAVGGCVAGKFRSAHVPPFAGGPVPVGKSFTIN